MLPRQAHLTGSELPELYLLEPQAGPGGRRTVGCQLLEETGLSDYEQIYRAQVLCLRKVNGLQNISERDVCSAI